MTFLGLTKEGWEIAGAIAACLGVVATVFAVYTSLHLARRESRVALKVRATMVYLLGNGSARPYVSIDVVNLGRPIVKVTSVGWRIGPKGKQRFFSQLTGPTSATSSPLPVVLEHGHDARWLLPAAEWLSRVHLFQDSRGVTDLDSFRVIASSSIGTSFEARIDKTLREEIERALLIQQAEGKLDRRNVMPD